MTSTKGGVKMVSEAQKRARAKYNAKTRKTMGCMVKNEEYEEFKRIAESRGQTISGMLLDFVRQTIAENQE